MTANHQVTERPECEELFCDEDATGVFVVDTGSRVFVCDEHSENFPHDRVSELEVSE